MEDSFTFSAQSEPRKMIEGLVMSSAGGGLRFDVLREEVDEILTNKATKGNNKVVKPSVMDVSKLTGKKVLTNISNRLKMKEVDNKYRPLTGGDLSGTGLVNEGKESDMEEVLEDSTMLQLFYQQVLKASGQSIVAKEPVVTAVDDNCDVHLRDSPTLVYARFAPRGSTVTHKVLSALGRPGLPRHNALTVLLRLPQIRI
ncbi:hypothetical protein ACOSQ2_032962 [Xanthoceras sorbifolium]